MLPSLFLISLTLIGCLRGLVSSHSLRNWTRYKIEFVEELESLRCVRGIRDRVPSDGYYHGHLNASSLPSGVNWLDRGCVTPVKNQKMCGSCWAFSVLGSLEGVTCVATGKLNNLSEQQLVDCCSYMAYGENQCLGCDGAWPEAAFLYIRQAGGVMLEDDYPYTHRPGACRFQLEKAVAHDCGFIRLSPGDEEGLAEVLAQYGPISVSISTTFDFAEYKSGVFDDPECDNDVYGHVTHSVLVVGYGTTSEGIPYWLIKNSWGINWGDKGYIKFRRGKNLCMIATYAVFPRLDCS